MVANVVERSRQPEGRTGKPARAFYSDQHMTAESTGLVAVNVTIRDIVDIDGVQELDKAGGRGKAVTKATRIALAQAAERLFKRAFALEIDHLVGAYRVILRESLVRSDDPAIQSALNRARLQERILSSTSMIDQTEACELLGLSKSNPSATMRRKEERGEVLRFSIEGRAAYPFFQFDVESRRTYPVISRLIEMKPESWSDFRLLYWLTRPHVDFEGAPEAMLGSDPDGVVAAFEREIEPAVHG
ncbi:hypothetical protein [Sphingomonas sp. BK069]|uniref:hypothetical protein n=1 Tax=Sphingomonas sp. BK069 TaxID=2586979 RepID=UPI00161B6692|nr:hypothetical protein [Sphingomonas sp. BK069]MBB3350046.1 hypothetical protein [Sphingomonas sp. BK069]